MENGVPPHFHKNDRIEERDLIPNGQVLSALPVTGQEGERCVVLSGSTFTFYQYLNGGWRQVSGASISLPLSVANGGTQVTSGIETVAAMSTTTLNLDVSNKHIITLTQNITLALNSGYVGQAFVVILKQDGTGSRTVNWFSTVLWPGGVTPTLTTTANKTDVFGFINTSSGNYVGFTIGQNL